MKSLTSALLSFVIGLLVSAYILSHTSFGIKIYTSIAELPTVTKEDIKNFVDQADKGLDSFGGIVEKGVRQFGGK